MDTRVAFPAASGCTALRACCGVPAAHAALRCTDVPAAPAVLRSGRIPGAAPARHREAGRCLFRCASLVINCACSVQAGCAPDKAPLGRRLPMLLLGRCLQAHLPAHHRQPTAGRSPARFLAAVAIGLEEGAFPLSSPNKLDDPYPPSVLIHFTADKSTDTVRTGWFVCVVWAATWHTAKRLPCQVVMLDSVTRRP